MMEAASRRSETFDVEFLVLGGGMAGMTAAARVARAGKHVMVVEKDSEIGGSARLSGGKLWTAKDKAHFAAETPGGDPALAAIMLDRFDATIDWLKSTGIHVADMTAHLHYGKGHDFDIVAYLDYCRMEVERHGGWVIRNAAARELTVEAGHVHGATITDRDGETIVRSPWTLLATGGFGASPDLRARWLHPGGEKALARCTPCSTGDGLRLGLAAGGATSANMKGFYGHTIQAPASQWGPREFRAYTQGGSIQGVLLNRDGCRFCDESLGDHQNAQRILAQPDARALLVIDAAVRRDEARTILAGTATPIDKVQIAIDEGAHVAVADDWEALFAQTAGWGFASEAAIAAMHDINAFATGSVDTIAPPRLRNVRAYTEPPFYAIEVQPGVTATHGGLRIDQYGQVLRADGMPVPGLLAAGADTGNVHGEGYAGGLCFAATFALLAAERVLANPDR